MHLEQSQYAFHVMRWQQVMILTVLERHGAGWVGGIVKEGVRGECEGFRGQWKGENGTGMLERPRQ